MHVNGKPIDMNKVFPLKHCKTCRNDELNGGESSMASAGTLQ